MSMRALTVLFVFLFLTIGARAEQCADNFKTSGNMLTGKSFKTDFDVAATPADAYSRIYAFTSQNGFVIQSSNAQAGMINAAQANMAASGKTLPLTIQVAPTANGARVVMSFATGAGQLSTDDVVKKHFCATAAAAGSGAVATAAPTTAPVNAQAPRVMPGFAIPTDQQLQDVEAALKKSMPTGQMAAMVKEAAPQIIALVSKLACLNYYAAGKSLVEYQAPNALATVQWSARYPMSATRYHNQAACMDVIRISGWVAPANNALRFQSVFKAADSGEGATWSHEIVKQPDGTWLFTQ